MVIGSTPLLSACFCIKGAGHAVNPMIGDAKKPTDARIKTGKYVGSRQKTKEKKERGILGIQKGGLGKEIGNNG